MKQVPKNAKKLPQKTQKTSNLTEFSPKNGQKTGENSVKLPQKPAKMIETFLSMVHRYTPVDAFLALTTIKDTMVRTRWYRRSQQADLISQILQDDRLKHIYLRITPVGALPESGRGVEADAIGTSVLYVDYDTGIDYKAALSHVERLDLPPSMIVHSGGGLHLYWLLDRLYTDILAIKARNKELALMLNRGNDLKLADSCFDLARVLRVPGSHNIKRDPILATIISYHPDRIYTLDQFQPAELTDQTIIQWDADPLAPTFLDTIRDNDKKLYQRIVSEATALKADAPTKPDGSIDRSRNDAYIATRLLGLGYSPGQLLSVLTHPLWLSGAKYRATGRFDYVVMTANTAYHTYLNSPDRFYSKRSLVIDRITDALQQSATFLHTGENLYRYENGVFNPNADHYVKAEVIKYLGPKWTPKASDDTVRWLTDHNRVPLTSINNHKGLINVHNGMLDPTTGILSNHSPTYRSLAQLPVAYNRSADTTAVDNFVAAILPADAISVFWEYIGSALLQDQYWPKNFLALVGAGDTGKSKLLKFINLFFGKHNVSNVALQTLASHRFAGSNLFGKYANIFADLSEAEANDPGPIKALTGDDQISGEEKFKGIYFFTNTARLIFSANDYPRIKRPDKWYFKRAIIIPCSHQFDIKTADPNILETLATSANFEAALLRAVEGVQRIIAQNGFSQSASIARANAEYRYQADTVSGFLNACTINPTYVITKQRFYDLYRAMCKAHNRPEVSADLFYKRVNEYADQYKLTSIYKSMPDDTRVWCYVGLQPEAVPAAFTVVLENN